MRNNAKVSGKKANILTPTDHKPKKKMPNAMGAGNMMLGLSKGKGAARKTPSRKVKHRKMP